MKTVHHPRKLAADLGKRLARHRLSDNITQETLAGRAGIAKSTLRRLEAGQPSTLDTFLRVLIALDMADNMALAVPEQLISPIELMDNQGKRRQRARPKDAGAKGAKEKGPWTWGDDK